MKPKEKTVKLKANSSFFPASSTQRILDVLCTYSDKEYSLSDIAKKAHVAKPHVGKILEDLLKKDLIKIEKLSKIWRISANLENIDFVRYKIATNLLKLNVSGLIEFLNLEFKHPKAIILFGSFRKGLDISSSDIDIAIEVGESENYERSKPEKLAVFESKLKRKIQIHVFTRNTVDTNVFANIANGIVLSGFLEVNI